MKRCELPPSFRRVQVLVILALAASAVFPLRAMGDGGQSFAACAMIGGSLLALALYLLWRTVSWWGRGVFYDDRQIVFVLSRKDHREYRWEDLAGAGVTFAGSFTPPFFCFPDGKRLVLNPQMVGCAELMAELQRRGMPAAASFFAASPKDISRIFRESFGQEFGGEDSRRK